MALTKVSYSMIESSPLNLRDYGAAGDGTTNDTAAWVAFTSACAAQSKSGFVPSGTYLIDPFTFTQTHSGMKLFGETYGRNGTSPGPGGVPAGPGVFGVSPTELRCRTAGTAFITMAGMYDSTFTNISLNGMGLVDDVLYFTGVENNTHGQWNNSFFYAAKATTGNIHHYGGTSGGEGWTFFQCILKGTFPNVDANNPAYCLNIENTNAFLGSYESCIFYNAKTALVNFSQGAANLINCEFYSAGAAQVAQIQIINGGQGFSMLNPYTEQGPNIPFIKQVGTAGVFSIRPIIISGIQNASSNAKIQLNCQQPVIITGGFMGSNDIDITPYVVGPTTYGQTFVIVDGVQFTTGTFTGTGIATKLITRGCTSESGGIVTPKTSLLLQATVAALTNTGTSVLDASTVLTATGLTPAVPATKFFTITNAAPTSINTFTGGVNGQEIVVRLNNTNTTFVSSASGGSFILTGGVNYNPIGGVISFICIASGTLWAETSRAAG